MSRTGADWPADGSGDGGVGATVAVLLSRFPTVTETFILREVDEMERQGQAVRLVPLLREEPEVVHQDARPWMGRALFTEYLSRRILGANLRAFLDAPGRYLSVVGRLVRGMIASPPFLIRSLALFPKAIYLARRLEAEGIRHVHAHYATHPATVAWVMAELSGISFSVTAHAHDIFVDQTFLEEKLETATLVRVISAFNRDYLLSRFPQLEGSKVHVVHAGVDVGRYAVGRRVRSHSGNGSAGSDGGWDRSVSELPLVLAVASLRRYKGVSVLLEACYLLQRGRIPLQCAVAGDGPLRDELEALIAAYGLDDRAHLLGAVSEDEVRDLLARASVFVLPSLVQRDGQMDGIPVALMEAMAAGVPVVASELSGIPELVEDGTSGILVSPGNADAVATAVRTLLTRPRVAREIGERGRERVREAFSLQGTVSQLLDLLAEEAVAAPSPDGGMEKAVPVSGSLPSAGGLEASGGRRQ